MSPTDSKTDDADRSADGRDDREIEQLFRDWLKARAIGRAPSLEAHCAKRPDLLPALRDLARMNLEVFPDEEPETDTCDPLSGKLLGERYRIEGRLGAGGMGLVYRARDERLGRQVAVKLLDDIFASDPERRERFRREAKSLATLENPHIVAVHDARLDASPCWIVMDYVKGFDLARFIEALRDRSRDGALPDTAAVRDAAARLGHVSEDALVPLFQWPWPELVARLGFSMTKALGAAHDAGLTHRDVKPSNFMLDLDGRLRLLDFGLARRAQDAALTKTASSVGTPRYMSPEQVRGREAGPLSDQFSLGATLYHLLCLHAPFAGQGRSLETSILYDEPEPPQKRGSRVSAELGAILLTALQKDPRRRYPGLAELGADLERFLAYEPVEARPRVLPAPMRGLVASWRRWRPPTPVLAVGVVALLGVVLVLAGLFGDVFADRELARARRVSELRVGLPPVLGLWGRTAERLAHPGRAAQLARLTELTELAPADDEALFLRWLLENEDPALRGAATRSERELTGRLGAEVLAVLVRHVKEVRDKNAAAAAEALARLDASAAERPIARRLGLLSELARGRMRQVHRAAVARGSRPEAFGLFLRGSALLGLSRAEEALGALRTANELAPDHPPLLHQLGRALLETSAPAAEAVAVARRALELAPGHVNYHRLLSRALRAGNHFDEAEARLADFPAGARTARELELANLRIAQGLVEEDPTEARARFTEAERRLAPLADTTDAADAQIARAASQSLALARSRLATDSSARIAALLTALGKDPLDAVSLANLGVELAKSARMRALGRVHLERALRLEGSETKTRLARYLAARIADDDPEGALEILVSWLPLDRVGDSDRTRVSEILLRLSEQRRLFHRARLTGSALLSPR